MAEEGDQNALVPANQQEESDSSDEDEFHDAFSISSTSGSDDDVDVEVMGAHQSSHNSSRSLDESADQPTCSRSNITFNRALPPTHTYLGRDLEELAAGQTVHESDEVIDNVALLALPNFVLMPNQSLPLQSLHPRQVAMFRILISQSKVFGVVLSSFNENNVELANIGTLAQVIAYKEETEQEITSLKIRAVGRQRFRILETRRQMDGVLVGKIRVLPEIETGLPLKCAESTATTHLRLSSKNAKVDKYFCSFFTAIPKFVFKQYDNDRIINFIVDELKQWYDAKDIHELSADPTGFSYWVASILPIEDHFKIYLLGINCAIQRLRCEMSLLQGCTLFRCRSCRSLIGRKGNVFSMSVMGPLNAYVNPSGCVLETMTLSDVEANSAKLIGRKTTENSWFPGYAWTIVQCAHCREHLGWFFTSVKKGLKPDNFWGITRSSILPTLADGAVDPEDVKWLPTI